MVNHDNSAQGGYMETGELNWTGKLADFFTKNTKLSLLLVLALFSWGLLSFLNIPRQYNPQITAPAFQIRVEFPGADRHETLEQVTRPLENVIANIPNVDDIFSTTLSGGVSIVNVNYFVGEDPDKAKVNLNDRIASNLNLAPLGIKAPSIRSIDPDDIPVATIALTSDTLGPIELRKFAFRIRERLGIVQGVSRIDIIGGRRRELSVIIDPARLNLRGTSLAEIETALRENNIYMHTGQIKGKERYIPLEARGTIHRGADLGALAVVTGDAGQIFLRDIARIEERVVEEDEYVRHLWREKEKFKSEEDPILLGIARKKGVNITAVTDLLTLELEKLKQELIPNTIKARIVVNEGDTARIEINRLLQNLGTAILIVVAILIIFLDSRAALLVAISIPLTLACVFILGLLVGQTVNRITLFALILSLGLLVDNASVVVENIVRQLSEHKDNPGGENSESLTRRLIIVRAVNEVGPGLVMSTITSVLAFIPMAFVTGMMGPYMGPIPFFVPAALTLSLFLSLSVTPWMAAALLKRKKQDKKRPAFVEKITNFFFSLNDRILGAYKLLLHRLLHDTFSRRMALLAVGLALVISVILPGVALVKFRMLPKADREQFFLYVDLPEGTSLIKTRDVTLKIEKELLKNKHIKMLQSYIGRPPILDFNGLFRGVEARFGSHLATIRVGLTDPEIRSVKSEEIVLNLRQDISQRLKEISPEIPLRLKYVEDPPGPPVLSTLLVRVQGYDTGPQEKIARDLQKSIRKIEGVVDIDISSVDRTNVLRLKINHKRASQSRVSAARIINNLSIAFAGKNIGVYHNPENLEQEYIALRLDKKFRKTPDILKKLRIFNDRGISLPLLDLVEIIQGPAEKPLLRENRVNTVYLYGDMENRSIIYAAIDLLFILSDYKLDDNKGVLKNFNLFGATYSAGAEGNNAPGKEIKITLGGEWELTLEVFRDLGLAMGGAMFLVYFALVAQFHSFREPLVIMSTIPLSLIGVLPGFMLLGYTIGLYFNATSMIGVIALAGIAVNNSIILLEYLNSLRAEGGGLEDSLIQAGLTRFRPIMLTSITTILGSLTIIGDPVWAGLAYAIILGLGVSSLLTLLVFPVLYKILVAGNEPDNI